jgi:hypothetical protein
MHLIQISLVRVLARNATGANYSNFIWFVLVWATNASYSNFIGLKLVITQQMLLIQISLVECWL